MNVHETKSSYGLRKSQLQLNLSASKETTSEAPGKSSALKTIWGEREKQCVTPVGTLSDRGLEECNREGKKHGHELITESPPSLGGVFFLLCRPSEYVHFYMLPEGQINHTHPLSRSWKWFLPVLGPPSSLVPQTGFQRRLKPHGFQRHTIGRRTQRHAP